MKHITSYDALNESVPHNGIVLIKGKPKGKDKERMLYAGHVIGSSELRPGATMLFMSDQFYRIIKEGDRLKGVKIGYRSEESLKDSLNLKSPGKISLMKNNNKTPYHWKTLKETSITQALDRVRYDLTGSSYLFESAQNIGPMEYEMLLNAATDSIFFKGKAAVVLGWETDDLIDRTYDEQMDPSGSGIADFFHEVGIDIVYTDPKLVEILKRSGVSPRLDFRFDVHSNFDYVERNDTLKISFVSHEVSDIFLESFVSPMPEDHDFSKINSRITEVLNKYDDVGDFLKSNHQNFKKLLTNKFF